MALLIYGPQKRIDGRWFNVTFDQRRVVDTIVLIFYKCCHLGKDITRSICEYYLKNEQGTNDDVVLHVQNIAKSFRYLERFWIPNHINDRLPVQMVNIEPVYAGHLDLVANLMVQRVFEELKSFKWICFWNSRDKRDAAISKNNEIKTEEKQ